MLYWVQQLQKWGRQREIWLAIAPTWNKEFPRQAFKGFAFDFQLDKDHRMPGLKPQKHQLYHLGPAFGYKQSDGMDFGEDPLKE